MTVKLYQGDCLEIMPTLSAGCVDMVLCDPPYGIDYKSNRQGIDRKVSVARLGDNVVRDDYFTSISGDKALPTLWITEVYRLLKDGGALYVFCHWTKYPELLQVVSTVGFVVKNLIVLNKSNHGMGDLQGSYAPKHEFLLYAAKGRHLLAFPNGRDKDVWDVPIKFTGSHREHPNEKPVSWHLKPLLNSCLEGGVVLDPFMGSGTTGVACVNIGRGFIGIESDANYFAIAERRIKEVQDAIY